VTDVSDLPLFMRIRQVFDRPRVDDRSAAVGQALEKILPPGSLAKGARVGVAVGSRGIDGLAPMVRAAVDLVKDRGGAPFVIPAMGSHGGASAEGQRGLLAHYGVSEEAMGCPVSAEMETRSLGRTASGIDVRMAEIAWESDGILLLNRIKAHTDFKGPIESGLAKICAVGLGKYDGAREIHRHVLTVGFGAAIREVAGVLLDTGRILGGVGILENAYHETARVAGVPARDLFETEERLLAEARRLMGRLPLRDLDVAVCDRLGKNISGAGLDTNVVGRTADGPIPAGPWSVDLPRILRIVVMELSTESDGNAAGMGMVDFVPERFLRRVDREVTRLNVLTGGPAQRSRGGPRRDPDLTSPPGGPSGRLHPGHAGAGAGAGLGGLPPARRGAGGDRDRLGPDAVAFRRRRSPPVPVRLIAVLGRRKTWKLARSED
jgi:hypothetical protein